LSKARVFAAIAHSRYCIGFRPPVIAELSGGSSGRRLKSAKAGNRGGGWCDGSAAGYGDLAAS